MKFKLNINKVQKALGKPIKRSVSCIGLDLASRTGWAVITTTKTTLTIKADFVNVKTSDIYVKLDYYIKKLQKLLKQKRITIIEDCYVGINPRGSIMLAKLEGVAYAISKLSYPRNSPRFLHASEARWNLNIKGNAKKIEVSEWLEKNLGIKVSDPDIADAIVLSINGVLV